ncbi:MAG TPA: SPOR domain-containing protein [Gemmatimonadota bacterium]|jgi:hypothetical protein
MAERPARFAARWQRERSAAASAIAAALALAASACASAPTTGESSRGRTEETVAAGDQPATPSAGLPPLDDARAVHGTIDPTTGRRTAEPAIGERLREPVRTEIQTGRLRQADEGYTSDAGTLPIGFRVQVMATPDFTTAGAEASRLKQRLGETAAVYVEYIDPYYKVRVGDFATQEAAQPTLDAVRGLGYRDAWAVRTTIKKAGP